MEIDYTVTTGKSVDEAAADVERISAENGFRVLAVHDVTATLAAKGFNYPPMKIVEVCNAKHAHAVLTAEPKISLMLPCPISVYSDGSTTFIATMLPTIISKFYPEADLGTAPQDVETALKEIVDTAK